MLLTLLSCYYFNRCHIKLEYIQHVGNCFVLIEISFKF